MMWSEWLSNAPTLIFLTIALGGKKSLNKSDCAIVISSFVCILFGFLPIIPQPQYMAYLWISMFFFVCLPVLFLPRYVSRQAPRLDSDIEAGVSTQVLRIKSQKQQFYSALWLMSGCLLFRINYVLAATKVIGPGESAGIFLLLTLLMKLFVASLADAHVHAVVDKLQELEMDRLTNLHDLERESNKRTKLADPF